MKKEVRTQIIFIVCFLAAWQFVYQTQAFSDLVFPSLGEIGKSFVEGFQDDSLLSYTLYSMELIAKGLAIGIVLASGLYLALSRVPEVRKQLWAA